MIDLRFRFVGTNITQIVKENRQRTFLEINKKIATG